MKKSKKPKKNSNCPRKKIPVWLGHKTSELIGFHGNVVIIQYKQMFKNELGSKLTLRRSVTCDVFSTFWVYSEYIGTHWHIRTSSEDYMGFNGGLFWFGVLSKVCLFERPCFFLLHPLVVNGVSQPAIDQTQPWRLLFVWRGKVKEPTCKPEKPAIESKVRWYHIFIYLITIGSHMNH